MYEVNTILYITFWLIITSSHLACKTVWILISWLLQIFEIYYFECVAGQALLVGNIKRPGPEVIKLEFILKLKIKRNDWLLADTCPQAPNHCALFWVSESRYTYHYTNVALNFASMHMPGDIARWFQYKQKFLVYGLSRLSLDLKVHFKGAPFWYFLQLNDICMPKNRQESYMSQSQHKSSAFLVCWKFKKPLWQTVWTHIRLLL